MKTETGSPFVNDHSKKYTSQNIEGGGNEFTIDPHPLLIDTQGRGKFVSIAKDASFLINQRRTKLMGPIATPPF